MAATAIASLLSLPSHSIFAAPRTAYAVRQAEKPTQTFGFVRRPFTIAGKTINIYVGPPNCTGGISLAAGIGGQLWYTLSGAPACNDGDIMSFSTVNASVTPYPVPSGIVTPANIVEGYDGERMWFTLQRGVYALGSVTRTGTFDRYKVAGGPPTSGIALGPDHRAWFGLSAGFIGAVATTGATAITRYRLHSADDLVASTAAGADGNIWFANAGSNGTTYGIGKISVGGISTDYHTGLRAKDVARGVGSVMWFTVAGQSKVGFLSTTGTDLTVFSQGISGIPNQIVAGPDGNEYFDEIVPSTGQAAVAKITPEGVVTEYALPYGFNPGGIAVGPDANVWVIDTDHDQLGELVVPPLPHNTWTYLKSMPTARSGACAGVIGSKVYVVGGAAGAGNPLRVNEAYDISSNSWSEAAQMPTARTTLACAVVGTTLYAIGGGTVSSESAAVEAYDAETNTWTAATAKGAALQPLPIPVNSVEAVSFQGLIYVVGGFTGSGRSTAMQIYNPVSNKWSSGTAMNVGRSGMALGLIGSTIVAADGVGGQTDNEAYSITTNRWTTLASSPTAKYNVCGTAIGDSLYVAGGSSGSPLAGLDIFRPGTNAWSTPGSAASMKTPVTLAAAAVVDGKLLCFGGGNSDFTGTVYNLVQSYQP
jgi:streptogramin lyase/N-acetylneuraminic acid mutarotase